MATLFAAPYVPVQTPFAPVSPYITLSEFNAAGTAVDLSQIIPGADPVKNNVAAAQKIRSASSWADRLCYQILAATTDVEAANGVYVRSDGTIRLVCRYWPVLEVDAISVGLVPSTMTLVTDTADLWLDGRKVIVVPVLGISPTGQSTPPFFYGPISTGARVFAQWTYVNGWPNALLAASAVAGATTITVTSTVGFYPGRSYVVHDWTPINGSGVETVTIAPGGVNPTTGVLTLTAGLTYAHTVPPAPDGITVGAMPDAVKQAVVLLTAQLIKTRGAESIELATIEQEPGTVLPSESGGFEDLATAIDLLDEFKRVT